MMRSGDVNDELVVPDKTASANRGRTRTVETPHRRENGRLPSSALVVARAESGTLTNGSSSHPVTDIPAFEARSTDLAPEPAIDAVRYLLASLQHRDDVTALPTRLAFTSALAGEGVTFVSRAVGSVLAHDSQTSVCVIDLNWHRSAAGAGVPGRARRRRQPRLGDEEASGRPGVAEVVRREVALREVIMSTDDPRLTTVTAGAASPAEGEVLARSPRLRHLIGVLERHNDHVVLALPPVLVSSAAIALAREAQAVGLVVRHGVTTEAQVRTAIERLGQIPFAGVVLNRTSSDIPHPLLRRLSNW